MLNRYAIEGALERGQLWAKMRNGRYWRLRRNGKTKLWKTRPEAFRISVKAGLRTHGWITHYTTGIAFISDNNWQEADFVITDSDPNTL